MVKYPLVDAVINYDDLEAIYRVSTRDFVWIEARYYLGANLP